jgi:hypothetical protein
VTHLQAADSLAAARAYATFATRYPKDSRAGAAQAARVALLRASGNASEANAELARLCARPTEAIRATCSERTGESEFRSGEALWPKYASVKLVIAKRASLTRVGVQRLSEPKRELLARMSGHFTKSIASGAVQWVSASSYYAGLAQWEYGNYLANVQLPADLTPEQRQAAQAGSARQAEQYYTAANKLWQALVDKAAKDKFDNPWVQRAKDALQGKVDANPPTAGEGGGS